VLGSCLPTWTALSGLHERRLASLGEPTVLACPRCRGRLRLIATVEDPAVVGKVLAHLGLLHPADSPGPAPPSADLRAAASSHQSSVPVSAWDSFPAGRGLTVRGRRRSIAADDWPGWGIDDAVRVALMAAVDPPPHLREMSRRCARNACWWPAVPLVFSRGSEYLDAHDGPGHETGRRCRAVANARGNAFR